VTRRILILTHEFAPFMGGIATYVDGMAQAASREGYEVTVVAPDFGNHTNPGDHEDLPYALQRFRGGRYAMRRFGHVLAHTARILANPNADVIHAAEWPYALALGLLPHPKNVRIVTTFHGSELLRNQRYLRSAHSPITRAVRRPDRITTNSRYTTHVLHDVVPGIPPEKVRTAPLGIAEAAFAPSEGNDVRAKHGIAKDARILLTVGRLDPRKGHALVLDALRAVPETDLRDVTYVIAGASDDDAYAADLRQRASTSPVPIRFLGRVSQEDVRALYATSEWFCLAATEHEDKVEGFGLVFLEAAAQGLPSLTTRVGAIPEVVLHERTGLVTERATAEGFTSILTRALRHPTLRRELGRHTIQHARSFTWTRTVNLTYGDL